MLAIFRYTLRRFRGQIIGWGIGLSLLGMMAIPMWDLLRGQRSQIEPVIKNVPPFLKAAFPGIVKMFTVEGFLDARFFALMPLILGIFAVLAGSGLVASDEENGTLDLLMAHPISRSAFFLARLLGFVTATVTILAIAWLGLVVPLRWSTLEVQPGVLVLPFTSLLAVLLLYGTMALLLSMVLPSRRLAAMIGGMAVVGSYFLSTFARLDPGLEGLALLSPLNYFQSGEAIRGLRFEWLLGLLAVSAFFAVLAWWRFERRDIRVAGEGSWHWPFARREKASRLEGDA